jgi:hypothetical protein
VTEQFALCETGTDSTAVQGNKRTVTPLAIQVMNSMR